MDRINVGADLRVRPVLEGANMGRNWMETRRTRRADT